MVLCPNILMKVIVSNRQKKLPLQANAIKKIVKAVIEHENQTCDEVYIHFVSTKTICQLHEDYFNDPTTTDCISFPLDEEGADYRVLGEVFVCPETAIDYAAKHDKNPYEECLLYVIHGLLHLMGYDDLEPKEKAKMRKAEKKHLLNIKTRGLC